MKGCTTSKDCDRTLAVNVVSTLLLAVLVLLKLQATATNYDTPENLTIVGSVVHFFTPDAQLQVAPQTEIFQALSGPKIIHISGT